MTFVTYVFFCGISQPNHNSSPGKLQKVLELMVQQSHSNVVVKVITKNKGLTFKCRLNAVNFIFLRRFVHTWSGLLELWEQKHPSVFGQLYGTVAFHSRGKGLLCSIHDHSVICIMTMMNKPSVTIREKKSLRTLLQMRVDCVCSWQLGWWGSNMEEVRWTLVTRYR